MNLTLIRHLTESQATDISDAFDVEGIPYEIDYDDECKILRYQKNGLIYDIHLTNDGSCWVTGGAIYSNDPMEVS